MLVISCFMSWFPPVQTEKAVLESALQHELTAQAAAQAELSVFKVKLHEAVEELEKRCSRAESRASQLMAQLVEERGRLVDAVIQQAKLTSPQLAAEVIRSLEVSTMVGTPTLLECLQFLLHNSEKCCLPAAVTDALAAGRSIPASSICCTAHMFVVSQAAADTQQEALVGLLCPSKHVRLAPAYSSML